MGFHVSLAFPIIFFSETHVEMRLFSVYHGLWQKTARMREANLLNICYLYRAFILCAQKIHIKVADW